MRFLVIEPEYDGHYLVLYIKFIIRILTKKKHEIIFLTTKEASKHVSFEIIKKENPNIKIKYFKYLKPKTYQSFFLLLHQIKLYFLIKKSFQQISKNNKIDHVFINSLDHYDKAISIFGSPFNRVKFSGIYVNPKFHLQKIGLGSAGRFSSISKFLFLKLLKVSNLKTIFTNDYFFIKYIRNSNLLNNKKVNFLYEPREFLKKYKKNKAREILKLPINSIQILVYGSLKESKGIKQLLEVLIDKNINPKINIILAGYQDKQIKSFLESDFCNNLRKNKKLFIFKGFQNDKMESLIFSAADIVWVGYQKNFPFLSGVLYQAAVKNIPIIASNHGIIGLMNKRYNLGYSVDIDNKDLLINRINLLCKKKNYSKFVINSRHFSKKANPIFFMKQIYKNLLD
jgi:glycosyltransferase involved in cell wall biosynthesis